MRHEMCSIEVITVTAWGGTRALSLVLMEAFWGNLEQSVISVTHLARESLNLWSKDVDLQKIAPSPGRSNKCHNTAQQHEDQGRSRLQAGHEVLQF